MMNLSGIFFIHRWWLCLTISRRSAVRQWRHLVRCQRCRSTGGIPYKVSWPQGSGYRYAQPDRPARQGDRREGGQIANKIKKEVTAAFEELKAKLRNRQKASQDRLSMLRCLPRRFVPARRHVITQTISELLEIFGRMGFDIAYGPEVEDEWHNFIALNIPEEHPARDPVDNFYIDDNPFAAQPDIDDSDSRDGKSKAPDPRCRTGSGLSPGYRRCDAYVYVPSARGTCC